MQTEHTGTNRRTFVKYLGTGAFALAGLPMVEPALASDSDKFYTQTGKDPTFKELLKRKAFPIGENSTDGVKGSTINVNHRLLRRAPYANRPVPEDILIHTLCNSYITREHFNKWTRWYQEDGSTQVFRLFKDEHNVRNSREGAARVEAFSGLRWKRGKWHAWQGTYTIVKPHGCMIFQAKNDENDWGVGIMLNDKGDIKLKHRRGKDKILARSMTGKSFLLGVRDNGHKYQVYYNQEKVDEGAFKRPKGYNRFRWGMYDGTMKHDAMIFVTGVRFE